MNLRLDNLDEPGIRDHMLNELRMDRDSGQAYESVQMTPAGHAQWPSLLDEAIARSDSTWLADAISRPDFWHTHYTQNRKNGPVQARVPSDAAPKLANGEFVIYYIRAVCLVALERGDDNVRVVRVRESINPRPESQALVGTLMRAEALLEDVRHNRFNYALGVPPGPNSGLAVALLD